MPPDCMIFTQEYDRALKLLKKGGGKKASDFCGPEQLAMRATAEFENCLKGDGKDSPRVLASRYADGTVDYAIKTLEVNNLNEQSLALREVELTYLVKTNEDGYSDGDIINDAAMIGNILLHRTADGDTPHPFSYLGVLFERLYKADKIYNGGSPGGFVKNLIILAAVAALLCAIWLIEPVSALFSNVVCGLLSLGSAFALGVFVWKKYQEYLGYFSGCLGYILAGGLGMVIAAIFLDKETPKPEANSAATVIAITAVSVVMMITYWIPSFFGNLRYMFHIASAREKYTSAKSAVEEYLESVRAAFKEVRSLISPDNPRFNGIYDYAVGHFSVVNENGEKAAKEVVWKSFVSRIEAAEKYYDNAERILGLY